MKRRAINIASAVSLVLCAGTVVVWVRSTGRFDRFEISLCGRRGEYSASTSAAVSSVRGSVHLWCETYPVDVVNRARFVYTGWRFTRDTTDAIHVIDADDPNERWRLSFYVGRFGFALWRHARQGSEATGVTVPDWALCILFAAGPVVTLARALRARRRRPAGFPVNAARGRPNRELPTDRIPSRETN